VVLASLVAACGEDAESARRNGGPPPIAVEIVAVRAESVDDALALTGQLEADESVMIRSETSGVVSSVEFHEGDEVAAGALLFRLRDPEQRARLREAEAQIVLTEQAWRRAETLSKSGVLSAADLDLARANRDAARARLDLARIEFERTQIRAPFAGMLGPRLVSPGDRITDQTELVQIDAVARLKVTFTVPEPAVPMVRVGQTATVRVAPFPDERVPARVFFVAPALDPASRRLTLKAEIDNAARKLRPGMFASIQLATARRPDALVIPESAVVWDTQGPFVWRVDDDHTAARASVQLGVRHDGLVEVTQGLSAGDRIVSAGTNKVIPGRAVATAEPPAKAQGDRAAP
jgi:membrane fusion protein (multidrug efflux system)